MENNYQLSRIHNYVTGAMSKEEMHVLEKEALQDPFLQDAIDGYKLQNGVDTSSVSILQKRLAERVEKRTIEKSKRFYSWQRLAVGLVAAVMFVVVCVLIIMKDIHRASSGEKTTEVLLMEQDFRVSTSFSGQSDVTPMVGWDAFNEELNSEVRDFSNADQLNVSFMVDNRQAKDISVDGTNDVKLIATIQEFISTKIKWQGRIGELTIKLDAKRD